MTMYEILCNLLFEVIVLKPLREDWISSEKNSAGYLLGGAFFKPIWHRTKFCEHWQKFEARSLWYLTKPWGINYIKIIYIIFREFERCAKIPNFLSMGSAPKVGRNSQDKCNIKNDKHKNIWTSVHSGPNILQTHE